MANRLKKAIVTPILTLHKRGWSQRKIARELGLSRTTVRGYLAGEGPDPNCTTNPPPGPGGGPASSCQPLREVIEVKLPLFQEAQRSVHRDGHVEVAKAYYSVPPEYVGRRLWVRWDGHLVRICTQKMEQIAVHVQKAPGKFSTHNEHIHARKFSNVERGAEWLLWRTALTCRFIHQGRDVLLMGPPGVGKSHLAQAIGYQAIRNGLTVRYRSIFDLVRDFLADEAFAGQDKVLERYLKPDLLVIDDMGIKPLPRRSGEYFFEVIMRRYEVKSTIMTSNRPPEEWGKLIGDVPAATAILDRFLHHAEIITITGRSYRLKDRARAEETPASPADKKPTAKTAGTRKNDKKA